MERDPLEIAKIGERYTLTFDPGAIGTLARAMVRAGGVVNGYTVETVLVRLSEIGEPEWGAELDFDSENDMVCVRSDRQAPLQRLVARLQRRLADPPALRRLVRHTVTE